MGIEATGDLALNFGDVVDAVLQRAVVAFFLFGVLYADVLLVLFAKVGMHFLLELERGSESSEQAFDVDVLVCSPGSLDKCLLFMKKLFDLISGLAAESRDQVVEQTPVMGERASILRGELSQLLHKLYVSLFYDIDFRIFPKE